MTQEEIDRETDVARLVRKRSQAWELSGLAHMDGDKDDARRYADLARRITDRILELA